MLRLRTLGGLSLEGSEGPPITAGSQRRRLGLFALLASAGERGVSRDKLLAYLWPEADPERAGQALTEMLAAIRTDTRVDDLFHGSDQIRLDPARCTSDVAEFELALDRRELGQAVAMYGGAFLDTFSLPDAPEFQRWVERERLRLEQRYRGALEALASESKAAGEHLAAARWWRRLAEVDPMSTHVALEVMSALAAGGDRPGAVAHAEAHELRIREEFGAAPNQAVRALAEKLKADPSYTPPPSPRASAPYRRSSGRKIVAPDSDDAGDADFHSTASRERGAMIAGRYLIQRELGKGGMATVFLAHDLKFDRDIALKFIHAELADAFGTERFQSEIAVLAKLQHPHILPLYDSGEVEGALFYVMPFVGGESLRDKMQREAQLPVAEALRLAREIAGALAYAHAQGVIHRDIKPENILLSNGHALVADFGIARAVSRAAGRRNTEDGFAVGTPAYMSPEQASGDPIDGRSDEYALACVIYEMLAGAPPFIGASGRSVIAQRFTEEPPSIKKARPSVPTEVDAALQKALQRVPADRFATVSDFARAIDVVDTLGRPRRSTKSGVATTLGKWSWAIAAAGAIALAAILLALRPPPLIPDLYAVLPFQHPNGAAPRLLTGNACQRLLYDAFDRWMGLKLVDGIRQGDAERRRGDTAITLDGAFAIARGLRAGRLVWGQVSQLGADIQVHGVVYDVARGTRSEPIRQ
ncbi:MAG TPA: protein kinase, partial [Gemmatimonadaceae bacterium]|nr:protein kinase [Gemmatimonadaceae bacterium]